MPFKKTDGVADCLAISNPCAKCGMHWNSNVKVIFIVWKTPWLNGIESIPTPMEFP